MSNPRQLDKLALAIGLGGVILAVLVGVGGNLLDRDFRGSAFLLFAATQIAAIVLGILSRETLLGKAAVITSSVLLIGSLATVA